MAALRSVDSKFVVGSTDVRVPSKAGPRLRSLQSLLQARASCFRTVRLQHAKRSFERRRHAAPRVVATSEFWYEEEMEFDAVTDYLNAKHVVLAVASEDMSLTARACSSLSACSFQIAFAGHSVSSFAEKLWEGRSCPPYFYKLRYRDTLDAEDQETCEKFWREVLQQNWGVELDYGLSGTEGSVAEKILVVCPARVLPQLLSVVGLQANEEHVEGTLWSIKFCGVWSNNGPTGGNFDELVVAVEPSIEQKAFGAPVAKTLAAKA